MARFARIAVSAALVALCCGMQASASMPGPPPGVRLDPARVFNPQSESLFAPLSPSRTFSFVTASLFGRSVAFDQDLPLQFTAPSAAGRAVVSFTVPQVRSTFEPRGGQLAYLPSPSIPNAPLRSSRQEVYAPPALQTAAPQPPMRLQTPNVNFGSYAPYAAASAGMTAGTDVAVRIGRMHFDTAFRAMQRCGTADEADACRLSSLSSAQAFTAGTAFNVRAGGRNVNLQISSGFAHLNDSAAGVFPYVPPDTEAQAGVTYAGLTDVVEHNLGAAVAVPLTGRMTLGLQFNRAHYQGDFGSTLLPGYAGMRDTYLGDLTYRLQGSSALTLTARQYRYQDLLAPDFNVVQTRADLNFTVKF